MIRAMLFDGPGQFRPERLSRPVLAPGEALARISLCTICGSDLHTAFGRRTGPTPCVLGHEPVGVIEEVCGDLFDVSGQPVRVGERVVWSVAVSCGHCFYCTRGLPQKCESLLKYGHVQQQPERGPFGGLSSHSQLLAGTALVKVPNDLPEAVAAPSGCATATIAATRRAARLTVVNSPGGPQTVVVLGLGMLGLTACAWLAAEGRVAIACDRDERRLEQAKRFGAAHTALPRDLPELVRAVTATRGADAAFELSGSADSAALSLEVLRIGGTAVWVGSVFPTPAVPVLPEMVVRRCLTVTGVHNYAPADLMAAVTFLAENHTQFPFAELVSRTFPLESVPAAFQFAETERPVRVAIRCNAGET